VEFCAATDDDMYDYDVAIELYLCRKHTFVSSIIASFHIATTTTTDPVVENPPA